MSTDGQLLVDPAVSRVKFARELADYRTVEAEYRRRGILLLGAEFPTVSLVFAAPHVVPSPAVFGAELDFSNYDLLPPEVTLVNPFTREPYRATELPTHMPRLIRPDGSPVRNEELEKLLARYRGKLPSHLRFQSQRLLIWHDPEQVPFLCLPGVRAYHEHPEHSGNSWLLHRVSGAGRLATIAEHLYRFGVLTVRGYAVDMNVNLDPPPKKNTRVHANAHLRGLRIAPGGE
jgi:Predicted metal binding domain